MLSNAMLGVVMISVIMMSVYKLSVVAPLIDDYAFVEKVLNYFSISDKIS